MMKTIKLARVLFKSGLTTKEKQKQMITGSNIYALVLGIGALGILYVMFRLGITGYHMFADAGAEAMFLKTILVVISITIFVLGLPIIITTYYLSSNLDQVLVMPYTPIQIIVAKLIVTLLYQYYISVLFLAPLLVGIGYASGGTAIYWLGAVLAVLLVPVVPLVYAGILSIVFMRIFGTIRNKEITAIIGAIATFVFYMLFDTLLRVGDKLQGGNIPEEFQKFGGALRTFTIMFPELPFLEKGLLQNHAMGLVWYLLIIMGTLLLFILVAKYLYLPGVLAMKDGTSKHQKIKAGQMKKLVKPKSVLWSYTLKEVHMILRTPAYLILCVLMTFFWPVVMIVPFVLVPRAGSDGVVAVILGIFTNSPKTSMMIVFSIVVFVSVFISSLNAIAPTALSREGKSFFIMKQLPISYKKQLQAKRNAALLLCGISTTGYLIIAEIVFSFWVKLPLWVIPFTILLSIPALYITLDIAMMLGMRHPNLTWENEAEVGSTNGLGILTGIMSLIICFSFLLLVFLFLMKLNLWSIMGILCAAMWLLAFIINKLFYRYGNRRLEKL